MPPLVSVITTSYNRAEYIGSTIESVLHQTFQDFEYLIVDDCSSDDSLQVARRYLSDRKVKVMLNERNLGDYGNRNRAAEVATGKYLKYVDCDDVIYPHCLQTMLENLQRYPEAGVLFSTKERPPLKYPAMLSPEQTYRLHFAEGGVLHQGALSALIRKDAWVSAGGFPEIFAGDVGCWLNLARMFPVVLIPEGLFYWRPHAGQLSNQLRAISTQWATHQAEGALLEWNALNHPQRPLPRREREYYKSRMVRQYGLMTLRNLLRGRFSVASILLRRCPFRTRSFFSGFRGLLCVPRAGFPSARFPN